MASSLHPDWSARKHDLVVIAGHGRPVPGIVHYFEAGAAGAAHPAALLAARTSDQLVLAACWGAHAPCAADSDPLTLATIALTWGSRAVLATTSELADDPLASRFLNGILHQLPSSAMPVALRDMTRRFLTDPGTGTGTCRAGRHLLLSELPEHCLGA